MAGSNCCRRCATLKAGVSQAAIDVVRAFKPGSSVFTEAQGVALELADAMTRRFMAPGLRPC